MTLPQPDPPKTKAAWAPRYILVMFAVLGDRCHRPGLLCLASEAQGRA